MLESDLLCRRGKQSVGKRAREEQGSEEIRKRTESRKKHANAGKKEVNAEEEKKKRKKRKKC